MLVTDLKSNFREIKLGIGKFADVPVFPFVKLPPWTPPSNLSVPYISSISEIIFASLDKRYLPHTFFGHEVHKNSLISAIFCSFEGSFYFWIDTARHYVSHVGLKVRTRSVVFS
ncbi:hypothetical protein RF11_03241 [Thelohanellus kitauei]|uniref:Uncharacterized protein n=1 Tax=Thelohanellus kitauei TaxID=669202 RepID=A0A0C2MIL3_THEKT|nr:hypothetical protein RF11_03241 [Thelohanellus kitauei]